MFYPNLLDCYGARNTASRHRRTRHELWNRSRNGVVCPNCAQFNRVAVLMLVLSAVGLIVGSEINERHRMSIDLSRQTTYLDSLIQNSPLGIVVLGRQGAIDLANLAFETFFQYDTNPRLAAGILLP